MPASYKLTVVAVASVMIPISVPVPAGYDEDPATFVKMVAVEVRDIFELAPFTTIEAVSEVSELAETQPM